MESKKKRYNELTCRTETYSQTPQKLTVTKGDRLRGGGEKKNTVCTKESLRLQMILSYSETY